MENRPITAFLVRSQDFEEYENIQQKIREFAKNSCFGAAWPFVENGAVDISINGVVFIKEKCHGSV